MTEPAMERRRKVLGRGAVLGLAYALSFVVAVVASIVVIYTSNETWTRFGLVFALWAALGWAFIADQSRRKSELVSAKASDYKLIYDLQLEREIAARHHYELSLENELRKQLTAEVDATTHNVLAELQQQVAVLRGQLQELLDQDLEYDQPALKARATRLDELLVARQSLGTHDAQPRKRAAEPASASHELRERGTAEEAAPSRLWLPSQPDQARREHAQQHREGEQEQHIAPQAQPEARQPQPAPEAFAQTPQAEPEAQSAPEPVVEQWQHPEQPVVWQQQQPQEATWNPPTAWEQLGAPPTSSASGGEQPAVWEQPRQAPETERVFDYPSWYAGPTAQEASPEQSDPSAEYPNWYAQPSEEPSGDVAHEITPLLAAPEEAAPEAEPAAEPESEPVAPEPVAAEPEPVVPEPEPEPATAEPQPEVAHSKAEKSKHAGKANSRAKPNESRSGRRAKPVDSDVASAAEGEQDAAAVAAALAGAHASGHSVGELLSRLSPDEAAGYHGRRRRTRMSGEASADDTESDTDSGSRRN